MSSELKHPDFRSRLDLLIGREKPFMWASRVGISKGAFSRIWNEGTFPGPELLLRIYEATNVNLHWLLTGQGQLYASENGIKDGSGSVGERPAIYNRVQLERCPLNKALLKDALLVAIEWFQNHKIPITAEGFADMVFPLYDMSQNAGKTENTEVKL